MCLECALVQVHLVHVLEHMVLTLIDPKLVRMLPNIGLAPFVSFHVLGG